MKKSAAAHLFAPLHPYLLTVLLLSSFAAPVLASPQSDLVQTREEMEAARHRQAQLASQSRKLQDELKDLKEKLVQAAAQLQKSETDLAAAEDKLHSLNDQLQEKDAALKVRRKRLASLLQAALSLSRTPPEAMVMMPGDAMEAMQAARALAMVSDAIRQESESIAAQIGGLQDLKQKVTAERDTLAQKQAGLVSQRESLNRRLKQRTALQATLGTEQEAEAKRLARLAKKAENLQDLVASLQESAWPDAGRHGAAAEYGHAPAMESQLRSFATAAGRVRQPAAGRIVQRFGDGRSRTSKGIVIATRKLAQVIAPFDGEVVYAGRFLNYGRMVIIRHNGGFHTLLAGLAEINVAPGEFLLEGEPIGAMGEDANDERLYVELRKDNQPVDPAPWIGIKE